MIYMEKKGAANKHENNIFRAIKSLEFAIKGNHPTGYSGGEATL